MAASALLLGWLAGCSLRWPLIHDAPLMHYIAWLVGRGAVPYRDIFDINLPGAYLLHAAVLAAAGGGDLAWRLFDLLWLVATAALVFAYGARMADRWAGGAAALLFALYHIAGGPWRVGQRDFFLCLLLLAGAHGTARFLERGGALTPLVWAGLFLGAGVTLKPYAGAFWLACVVAAAVAARRLERPVLGPPAVLVASGLAVPALVFGWLAWRGGLAAFLEILTGYVIPLYSGAGRGLMWRAMGWHGYDGWAAVAVLAVLALLGAQAPLRGPRRFRRALALSGVGYGALHFALQGKGWEYHLYPLVAFLCAVGAAAFARPEGAASPRTAMARVARPAAVAALGAAALLLGVKGVEALEPEWIAAKARRVDAVTRDLGPLVPPGGTVQVLDTTEGGVHALLRLGLRQPTPYLYDFPFFHDVGDPRIERLRRDFARRLDRHPPAAVVVFRDSWPGRGYDRLAEFPRLRGLLDRRYALVVDRDEYRIYAKRSDP